MRSFFSDKNVLWILVVFILVLASGAPVLAGSTEIHLVKYASDRTTILSEKTITYQEMEDTLPVQGDGTTHYYLQGPVFVDDPDPETQEELRWNPEEDTNVQQKDMGAVKGTDLKDLCTLVGGMSSGDTLTVVASDGMTRDFAYKNVYSPPSRQGPVVVTWYMNGKYPDTGYDDGMRLVFFADDSVNPWGIHAMGNFDWHESADEEYWYYYYQTSSDKYPTTTGLSMKYVSEIRIYSSRSAKATGGTGTEAGGMPADDASRYGYKGSKMSAYASGTVNGTIRFLTDAESTPVIVNNRIREYAIPFDMPPGSNLTLARMYLYVSRSREVSTGRGVVPSLLTSFNGNLIGEDQVYIDTDSDDNRNVSATFTYDVLPYLSGNGTYRVSLRNLDFERAVFSVEDIVVMVAYNEEQGQPLQYWINEGCDVIHSEPENGIFPEDASTSIEFTGAVNLSQSGEATLVLVATNIDSVNSTEHFVQYNKREWYNAFDALPAKTIFRIPVTSCINTTVNTATVVSAIRKNDADYLVSRNAVLLVRQDPGSGNATTRELGGDAAVVLVSENPPTAKSAVTDPERPPSCSLSLHSNPEGALIYLDGDYLGTTTPYTLEVPAGAEYAIRFEREGYITAERNVTVHENTTLRENLYSEVYWTKGRSDETVQERNATFHGGLYVHSRPGPASISIDGTRLNQRTPAIIFGIEEGSHVVKLSLEHADPNIESNPEIMFEAREVSVFPYSIVPVDIAANISPLHDVIIDHRENRGEPFTVNGNSFIKTIPAKASVPYFDSYLTVFSDLSYISYPIPTEETGNPYLLFTPREHYNLSIFVDSNPRGAEVFIDGFRTGFSTPFTFYNISDGQHRIMVTKLGYIPEEKAINLPYASIPCSTKSLYFVLDEYQNGFLRVKSDPAGARITLDGLDTGQTTPWVFSSVPTGVHSVSVSLDNVTKKYSDVTVNALGCTNISADLHEIAI